MRVGAAHVEPISIAHRLDDPYVIPAIEVLKQTHNVEDHSDRSFRGPAGPTTRMYAANFQRDLELFAV